MGTEFQQMEMLTIIMGNLQQIKNFKERTQKVFKDILPEGGDSKASRKQLVDKAIAGLKNNLTLPDESKDAVLEQFDPVMIINEIVAERLPAFFDALIDYTGDDAGFVKLIKTNCAEMVVKIIGEIEDGFTDGIADILVFFKANAGALLMASAPPQ